MANKTFVELQSEINLLEFALYNGYKLDKSSSTRRNPVLKGGSGETLVLKNTDQNHTARYFNATEGYNTVDRGNIIQFVKQRVGSLFPAEPGLSIYGNVNKVLHQYLNLPVEQRQFTDYKVPKEHSTHFDLNLYGLIPIERNNPYLTQIRGIAPEILQLPEFKGRIYTNKYQGIDYVTFPFYATDNTTICGLNFRSEDTNKNAGRADKLKGLWTSRLPQVIDKVILSESPIDAISYHELHGVDNSFYVSTFGRPTIEQYGSLAKMLELNKSKFNSELAFLIAFDRDTAGQLFSLQAANFFSDGSYYIAAGENKSTGTIHVNVFNYAKLSTEDKTLMPNHNPEDHLGGRGVFSATADSRLEFDFQRVSNEFIKELHRSVGSELIQVDLKEKVLSLKLQSLPAAAIALNLSFSNTFKRNQVVDVKPVIPTGKDFNEDLRFNKQLLDNMRRSIQTEKAKI